MKVKGLGKTITPKPISNQNKIQQVKKVEKRLKIPHLYIFIIII